ncbi:MAG TPA: hypothetical protein VIK81_03910 [Patescibacteria group bacterium]
MVEDQQNQPPDREVANYTAVYLEHLRRLTNNPDKYFKLKAIGNFWLEIREVKGLNRKNTVDQLEGLIDEQKLAAFEFGMLDPDDLPEGFMEKLAKVVGDETIFEVFKKTFFAE